MLPRYNAYLTNVTFTNWWLQLISVKGCTHKWLRSTSSRRPHRNSWSRFPQREEQKEKGQLPRGRKYGMRLLSLNHAVPQVGFIYSWRAIALSFRNYFVVQTRVDSDSEDRAYQFRFWSLICDESRISWTRTPVWDAFWRFTNLGDCLTIIWVWAGMRNCPWLLLSSFAIPLQCCDGCSCRWTGKTTIWILGSYHLEQPAYRSDLLNQFNQGWLWALNWLPYQIISRSYYPLAFYFFSSFWISFYSFWSNVCPRILFCQA
jgi:hypothetical protein